VVLVADTEIERIFGVIVFCRCIRGHFADNIGFTAVDPMGISLGVQTR
jgi:hypothetical protein